MAITIIGQEKESAIDKPTPIKTEYLGMSTDTKPTDCGVGSEFEELDTGLVYKFDGVWSQWEPNAPILTAISNIQNRLDNWSDSEDYVRQIDYMHDHTLDNILQKYKE